MATKEIKNINKDSDINHYNTINSKQRRDWYVPVVEFYFKKLTNINDKEKTLEFINAANGIYAEDLKKKFLTLINASKFIDEIKDLDVLDEIDLIVPITRRIIGEFIRQPDNDYTAVVKDPDATMLANKQASEAISKILMDKLMLELQQMQETAMKQAGQSPQAKSEAEQQFAAEMQNMDLDKEMEKIKTKYFNDQAEDSKAFVDAIVSKEDLNNSLIQQFFYFYATEEVYTVIDTDEDTVKINHIPPQHYYRFPATLNNDVEDDIAGMYSFEIPFYEFQVKFKDKFNKNDYDYIIGMNENNINGNGFNKQLFTKHFSDYYDTDINNSAIEGIKDNVMSIFNNSGNIKMYRLFFRSKRKYGILTTITPDGMPQEIVVDDTYKLNLNSGDVEIEWLWKDEVFEVYIAGNLSSGAYSKPQPLRYQREFLDDVEHVKLPVIGKSGLLVNYLKKPISYRLLPFNIIYKFLHIKIQAEIAKFQGFINVIPESVLTTSEHFKLNERLDYLFESNLLLLDDSQVSVNSLQAIRTIGSYHKDYIEQLQVIKTGIKEDAWEMADMNNERYGEIDTRGGQGNTREAIIRISTGTLLLFTTFDNYLEHLYQGISDMGRLTATSGVNLEYKDKDGKMINSYIDHNTLLNREIGIFFKKSQLEREKVDAIRNNVVQAAMQNNEFLLAIEAIDSENVQYIKKLANQIDSGNKEREKYFKELEADIEKRKMEREKESEEADYKQAIDVENIKGEYKLLAKDKDLLIKMIEFSSYNPDNNKYEGEIPLLTAEIEAAELELKKANIALTNAKTAEVKKGKPKTK